MGRRKKPDAFTDAEHQRRYVARHGLVTIKVTPEVVELLRAARVRRRLSTSPVLMAALQALNSADLAAAREVAALPNGPRSLGQPARTSRKPKPVSLEPDLFRED